MGGAVRRVGRSVRRAVGIPTRSQVAARMEAQRRAQEDAEAQIAAEEARDAEVEVAALAAEGRQATRAQQAVPVVDVTPEREPNSPRNVVYSGERPGEEDMGVGRRKRRRRRTIMTSARGVMGDAPTEKATLLGG